jgi:UDP-N-acetylglucosamine 2-epimerase
MEPGQTQPRLLRVLASLDPLLADEVPDVLLVQGDTSTALAGALRAPPRMPVGHVEAGLRSGDVLSPHPEEMNRRLVTRLATWHFAATDLNREHSSARASRTPDLRHQAPWWTPSTPSAPAPAGAALRPRAR